MDVILRSALRDYARGEVDQSVVLRALARSGFSRQASVESVDAALRRAFLEELDYGTVERRFHRPDGLTIVSASPLDTAPPPSFVWITSKGTASVSPEPPSTSVLVVVIMEHGLVSRDPNDIEHKWTPIQAEDLPIETERLVARELADVWVARQRSRLEAVRVQVWHPCRLDMLETGDMSDLRVSVSAPQRERLLVLETLMEAMPSATVVSSLVSDGKRPERHPKPKPGEAEWPAESKRVHVRG